MRHRKCTAGVQICLHASASKFTRFFPAVPGKMELQNWKELWLDMPVWHLVWFSLQKGELGTKDWWHLYHAVTSYFSKVMTCKRKGRLQSYKNEVKEFQIHATQIARNQMMPSRIGADEIVFLIHTHQPQALNLHIRYWIISKKSNSGHAVASNGRAFVIRMEWTSESHLNRNCQ